MTSLFHEFPSAFTKMYIGLDRLNSDLAELGTRDNYPPFNIIRTDPEHYTIEMALAGFAIEDISVTTKNGSLIVSSADRKDVPEDTRDYVWRGLAQRDFTRSFKLYENVKVTGADFTNGVLSIHLVHQIPDHLKPQSIAIKTR